jgi:hypothetical protein
VGGEQGAERESNQTTVDNDEESEAVEGWLIEERRCMEHLLVYEVEQWEGKLWKKTEEFIRSDEVHEKEGVEREWKANCWKRFDANIRAMNERMEAAKANVKGTSDFLSIAWGDMHRDIQTTWQSAMERFVDVPLPPPITSYRDCLEEDLLSSAGSMARFSSLHPKLKSNEGRMLRQQEEMESRLHKELDDIEFRLGQGLEECNQFWGSDWLVRARHSRAKWLSMPLSSDKAEVEVFSLVSTEYEV